MIDTNSSRARYTSAEAVEKIGNRYDLVIAASIRAKEISRGAKKLTITESGSKVAALEEIEAGLIGIEYLRKVK